MFSLLSKRWRSEAFAWGLLAPSLLFLAVFTFYPIGITVVQSFFTKNLAVREPVFAGWDNYSQLFSDSLFHKVMINNFWYMLGTVPGALALGLIFALFANRALKFRGFVRVSFFYPNVVPMIALANVWLFIYTPEYGLLSRLSDALNAGYTAWLGSETWVMLALIVMMVWKEAGYFMIFYLAGLQNIPNDLYEAAQVDGVSKWRAFWRITFPLLMPTTLFVLIVALTNAFKTIDQLFIMTQGGPNNASNLLLYYIYQQAFSYWDFGVAAASTIVMIILMLLITVLQFRLDKKIHYR
ncbi:sugar ABC transporter permease [Paenibacillus sp. FSL H7-0716]|uniref:ABC transporter permease n=1 Tax=Paenibacillus odorifer TaxID=189426 RepID=A0AB36JA24_9BACL|nr:MULTISPECIES: sugar ABC transporter permease [Paenibacillus]AIQ37173.1 ABC transporter permease [Paenibacillus sp. FSL R5-0345]OME10755.1 ABC transporter permease [Paenibacillus odorifer]OME16613.1 ABC transporter permease [Paenibacillus odorifer]